MNTNITKDIYIVECYQNGERAAFMRGMRVHAAPGHAYHAEFDTLEDAKADIRRLADDYFMRDGGEYWRILDEQGEAAADKARAAFVANGSIDDDLNYYGLRKFEVVSATREHIAHLLSEENAEAIEALDRLGLDYEVHTPTEFASARDPRESCDDANFSALSDLDLANAHHFIEVIA